MTDSLTQSDIDRIYGRIQEQVDLSKVKNKSEFKKEIKKQPDNKRWGNKLNDFFWDIHTKSQPVVEEVEEIEVIPFKPTPVAKRKRTIQRKKDTISVQASYKQKAYKRTIGRGWEDVEIKFAQRLRKDGLTHKQIATQLNRTSSSVSTKLSRMGG